MNKVFLIGRLSRDPELRHTNSGMAVCQINVAVGRRVAPGKEAETDFINVVVWDKQAENVSKYLANGRQVAVEGRIAINKWKDVSGEEKERYLIVANSVKLLGSKKDEAQ